MEQKGEFDAVGDLDKTFNSQYRAWRIVATMRWITLVLGPAAIIIDDILYPWMVKRGLPEIVTMEDLTRWFLLDLLPLELWIDLELFEVIYYHLTRVSCALFVLFVVWTIVMKRKAAGAAKQLAQKEAEMVFAGGEHDA